MLHIVGAEPGFRVGDLARALRHYARLGFTTSVHDATYGFAHCDDLTIHLMHQDGDHPQPSTLYLHVPDVDRLAAEWSAAGMEVVMPTDTDYGLREGSHTDPDGNVLRFGSPA